LSTLNPPLSPFTDSESFSVLNSSFEPFFFQIDDNFFPLFSDDLDAEVGLVFGFEKSDFEDPRKPDFDFKAVDGADVGLALVLEDTCGEFPSLCVLVEPTVVATREEGGVTLADGLVDATRDCAVDFEERADCAPVVASLLDTFAGADNALRDFTGT
jgi:hypothetical protein